MEIKIRKIKPALTSPVCDNLWRTSNNRPAIWGLFVDGIEKARIMASGSLWNVIDPKTFRNIINRTFDTKKDAIAAAKKMLKEYDNG